MNMFMRSIMNNRQMRTNRTHNRQQQVRRQFGFSNGYNQSSQLQSQNYSDTFPENRSVVRNRLTSAPISENEAINPSIMQCQIFNISINVNVNNLSSELSNNINPPRYFSEFSYEGLNIRFFHNEPLNYQNIGNEIESVLNNINEREFQNILNDFNDFNHFNDNEMNELINDALSDENVSLANTPKIIEKIHQNITHCEYVHCSPTLKNHTCPILLSDFEDKDIVSMFKLCNHAIHESTCEKYIKTFTKCPLCNNKLFE